MSSSESGYCQCGCGEITNLAPHTNHKRGRVKGRPYRFIKGHNNRDVGISNNLGVAYTVDNKTGCWLWGCSKTPTGYGQFRYKGKNVYAHRHFYEKYKELIPDGYCIDHLCRSRACVNPDHMEPVTQAENVRRGIQTKLTWHNVRLIRSVRTITGLSFAKLATLFGCSQHTIFEICHNLAWEEEPNDI